jgi:hypothetical protein
VILERKFPRNVEELIDAFQRETSESRAVVIHAGHFLLHYDEDDQRLIPCIATEMMSPRYEAFRREYGEFPLLSWKLACRISEALPAVPRYICVLVNDWQYVPKGIDQAKFYDEFDRLPAAYVAEVQATRGTKAKLLTPRGPSEFSASRPYFSERSLRNRYHKRVKRLIRRNALPEDVEINADENGVSCSLLDVMGEKREVYCASSDADCSSEVAELIDRAFTHVDCDTFINLYPAVCKEFVEAGSELPSRLFRTGVSLIINLALPASGVMSEQNLLKEAEMTIHRL